MHDIMIGDGICRDANARDVLSSRCENISLAFRFHPLLATRYSPAVLTKHVYPYFSPLHRLCKPPLLHAKRGNSTG